MAIYVEIRIRGSLDELWKLTQTAKLHERWDLRFSSISYEPREDDAAPQRFRYATRIGFGSEISGWGETQGQHQADGNRSSALKFGSQHPLSLIREGSGYWKYIQVGEQVRFLTSYDYQVRFGLAGRLFDRLLFRPLMGCATAWSFDRLRLWVECQLDPRVAARQALLHALATASLALIWIWHGLVPKLAGPHPDELAMLLEAGIRDDWVRPLTHAAGVLEVLFGLLLVLHSRRRWPWLLSIAAMFAATVGVLFNSPERALAAFNPVTLNLAVASLGVVGLLSLRDLPSARRCLRSAPKPSATTGSTNL